MYLLLFLKIESIGYFSPLKALCCFYFLQHSSTATNTANSATGASESADDDLPSVMTCANYLKLPPYSTKVLIFHRLRLQKLELRTRRSKALF